MKEGIYSVGSADRARSVRADGLGVLSFCFFSEPVERSVRTGASRPSGLNLTNTLAHSHTGGLNQISIANVFPIVIRSLRDDIIG